MPRITPTIGRKIYYYDNGPGKVSMESGQPFDATVIYVWPSNPPGTELVNLFVIDHVGGVSVHTSVPLIQENDVVPQVGGYAKWMPYQVGQATKSTESQSEPSTTATAEITPAAPAVAAIPESSGASASPIPVSPTSSTDPSIASVALSTAATEVAPSSATAATIYPPDFGGALRALRDGKKVMRSGWNGKGMFVYLVPAASYPAQTGAAKEFFGENAMVPYNAYLAIKNVDYTISTWVPSVNDCLADDWHVLD